MTLSQEHLENKSLPDVSWDQRTHMVIQEVKHFQVDLDTERETGSLGGLEIAKIDMGTAERGEVIISLSLSRPSPLQMLVFYWSALSRWCCTEELLRGGIMKVHKLH